MTIGLQEPITTLEGFGVFTREQLKELVEYDPETGQFTRNGAPVGYEDHGYIRFSLLGKQQYAHRLAWLYMTGEWCDEIDHKDGWGINNSWSNLRRATHSQNLGNCDGYPTRGVERHGRKYRARIEVRGVRVELGSYNTEDEARAAYRAGAEKHFGEFARHLR